MFVDVIVNQLVEVIEDPFMHMDLGRVGPIRWTDLDKESFYRGVFIAIGPLLVPNINVLDKFEEDKVLRFWWTEEDGKNSFLLVTGITNFGEMGAVFGGAMEERVKAALRPVLDYHGFYRSDAISEDEIYHRAFFIYTESMDEVSPEDPFMHMDMSGPGPGKGQGGLNAEVTQVGGDVNAWVYGGTWEVKRTMTDDVELWHIDGLEEDQDEDDPDLSVTLYRHSYTPGDEMDNIFHRTNGWTQPNKLAGYMGVEPEELEGMDYAVQWMEVGTYWGWGELDHHPVMFTKQELNERLGLEL